MASIQKFSAAEEKLTLKQEQNFILFHDYLTKTHFLASKKHFKINKELITNSSKLDETDCVLCFTATTCLTNPIIYCSTCERGAHRVCLRLDVVPSGDFFCLKCEYPLRKQLKKPIAPKVTKKSKKVVSNGLIYSEPSLAIGLAGNNYIKREETVELIVDQQILIMKNKNIARRTEDINRVLANRLRLRFDGKLQKLSEKWVYMIIPKRVYENIIRTLIKSNLRSKSKKKNGLVLDCMSNELYPNNSCSENYVKITENDRQEFDKIVESIRLELQNEAENNHHQTQTIHHLKSDSKFDVHLTNLPLDTSIPSFYAFQCKHLLFLRKILLDDSHVSKFLQGDKQWNHTALLQVYNEAHRILSLASSSQSMLLLLHIYLGLRYSVYIKCVDKVYTDMLFLFADMYS